MGIQENAFPLTLPLTYKYCYLLDRKYWLPTIKFNEIFNTGECLYFRKKNSNCKNPIKQFQMWLVNMAKIYCMHYLYLPEDDSADFP